MLIAYIKPSNIKNKRHSALIQNSLTGDTRKIDFADKRYQNFSIHQDKERRERYRQRHRATNINDVYSPAFWSYYLLWNKDSLEKSAADIYKRFNVKVILV